MRREGNMVFWSFVVSLIAALGPASMAAAAPIPDPVPICGDVNNSSTVTSTDALNVLKQAVNPAFELGCRSCPEMVRLGNPLVFSGQTNFSAGFLVGTQVVVGGTSFVTHFGTIPRGGGATVEMALYTDNAGEPGVLMASATAALPAAEAVEFPLPAANPIPAGVYWLMAVYSTTSPGYLDGAGSAVTVKYRSHSFGDPLPNVFGPAQTYQGVAFNYWIKTIQP